MTRSESIPKGSPPFWTSFQNDIPPTWLKLWSRCLSSPLRKESAPNNCTTPYQNTNHKSSTFKSSTLKPPVTTNTAQTTGTITNHIRLTPCPSNRVTFNKGIPIQWLMWQGQGLVIHSMRRMSDGVIMVDSLKEFDWSSFWNFISFSYLFFSFDWFFIRLKHNNLLILILYMAFYLIEVWLIR